MSSLTIELKAPNGKSYTQPTGLFINNDWVKSSKGNKIISISPTHVTLKSIHHVITNTNLRDESEICSVEAAEPEDIDKAVVAARKALKGEWRDMASTDRGELMFKLAALVEQHKETLATIETWDNGQQAFEQPS